MRRIIAESKPYKMALIHLPTEAPFPYRVETAIKSIPFASHEAALWEFNRQLSLAIRFPQEPQR